ncbi:MAG: RnfABCDGE type electron transport complex subunit D [bacterium]|nr:RnfABCDGE type electron transport complex subunit D [bacterium]
MKKIIVSTSPHIKNNESVPKIMWSVNLSLLPAAILAVYFFGLRAFWVMVVGIVTAVITEAIIQKLAKQEITIKDGSAFLTGLLLSFNVSSAVPLWIPMVGSFVAIAIAKLAFGGLGCNIFNPALIGRAFLLAAWPVQMTTWLAPFSAKTAATPLGIMKLEGATALLDNFGECTSSLYKSLFLGNVGGCLGEVSAAALLIGAIYLIYKKYINWQLPIYYIGTVALLSWIFGGKALFIGDPLFHVLSGGLILGAFFMATDMVTCPITIKGQIVFAIGAGIILTVIRIYGGYPEGCSYSILIMNAVTPLIDRYIKPKKYGA